MKQDYVILDSDRAPLGIAIHKYPNPPQFSNRRYKSVMESSTGSPFSCLCLLSLALSKINVLMLHEHSYDLSSSFPFFLTLVLYFYSPAARENIAAHLIVQYCLLIHQIVYIYLHRQKHSNWICILFSGLQFIM